MLVSYGFQPLPPGVNSIPPGFFNPFFRPSKIKPKYFNIPVFITRKVSPKRRKKKCDKLKIPKRRKRKRTKTIKKRSRKRRKIDYQKVKKRNNSTFFLDLDYQSTLRIVPKKIYKKSKLLQRIFKFSIKAIPGYKRKDFDHMAKLSDVLFIVQIQAKAFFDDVEDGIPFDGKDPVIPLGFALYRFCENSEFDQITLLASDLDLKEHSNTKGVGTTLMEEIKMFSKKRNKNLVAFIDPGAVDYYRKMDFRKYNYWDEDMKKKSKDDLILSENFDKGKKIGSCDLYYFNHKKVERMFRGI